MAEPTGLEPATSDVTGENPERRNKGFTRCDNNLPRHDATRADMKCRGIATVTDSPTDTMRQAIKLAAFLFKDKSRVMIHTGSVFHHQRGIFIQSPAKRPFDSQPLTF